MSMRGKRPRRKRWVLLGGLVAAAAVPITGWLMFQHIPAWYRPPAIAPADQQRVRDDLLGTLDALGASLVHSEGPFEHRFTQAQVNAWLAVREAIWPGTRAWLPRPLSDPFVAIDEGGVRLAATYRHGGLKTVLSARLELSADPGGVRVRLARVAGGSLGIPRSWVRDELAALDADAWPAGQRSGLQYGDGCLPALSGLFEGVVFPNAWIWKNGEQPFRITRLRFEPGALAVTFEPLPRHPSRRTSSHSPPGPAPATNRNVPLSSEPASRTVQWSDRRSSTAHSPRSTRATWPRLPETGPS